MPLRYEEFIDQIRAAARNPVTGSPNAFEEREPRVKTRRIQPCIHRGNCVDARETPCCGGRVRREELFACSHPANAARQAWAVMCQSCRLPRADTTRHSPLRVAIVRREGYEKPFTRELIPVLARDGIQAPELTEAENRDLPRIVCDKSRPDAILRWEEHGCLFVSRARTQIVQSCYRHNVAPLSIDLGYFDHYRTLIIDRYRPDGMSAIADEFASMPTAVDWDRAPAGAQEYRLKLLADWDQAGIDGPPPGVDPGYVLVFLQFSAYLARKPFAAQDMTAWAEKISARFREAGERVVLKASPVGPFPEIPGIPLFRSQRWGETDPVQNVRLLRWAKHSVICCSSVSNEAVILGLPVTATGHSWFEGLGVFQEPAGMDDLVQPPTVDPEARGRWINWWLARQFSPPDAGTFLRAAVERFRAQPFDYARMYADHYRLNRNYGARYPRADLVMARLKALPGVCSVLDAGCGQGGLALAAHAAGFEVHALDVAPQTIPGLPPGRFRQGNLLALPYDAGSFDAVVCMDTLEHLRPQDVPQALAELRRVSRGPLVVSVGACASGWPPPPGWPALHQTVHTWDEWLALFRSHGFETRDPQYQGAICNCVTLV